MANEFNELRKREQERAESESINIILQGIKDLQQKVTDLKKEVHTVREELRKLDKLRPLRVQGEEEETKE